MGPLFKSRKAVLGDDARCQLQVAGEAQRTRLRPDKLHRDYAGQAAFSVQRLGIADFPKRGTKHVGFSNPRHKWRG